ncbi:MAG: zinc ribbon domain-containing protein [Thermomicrobiales bacterium]
METCPNCGAVARPGAKFCTTCGTRLSGLAAPSREIPRAEAPAPAVEAAPFAAPSPSVGDAAWGRPAELQAPVEPEQASPNTEQPVSTPVWTWPTPAAGDAQDASAQPGDVDTSSALVDAPGSAMVETDEDEAQQLSSWAARWNEDVQAGDGDTASTSRVDADEDATEGIEGSPAGLPVPADAVDAEDEVPTLPDMGTIDLPDEQPGEQGFAGIEGAPAGDPDAQTVAPEVTPASSELADPASVDGGETAPLLAPARPIAYSATQRYAKERATILVDELRGLLPHLADATIDGRPTPATVCEVLQGALEPRAETDALRAAVRQAQANPRDLYAMMDLGRQAGAIAALLDERDRLRAAIEETIDAVREPAS